MQAHHAFSLDSATMNLEIQRILALAVFVGGRPFTIFSDPYMKRLLKGLNPSFKIPSRHTISTTLLDSCYNEVQSRVHEKIRRIRYLNVIYDESTTIDNKRTLNISLAELGQSYYLTSEEIPAGSFDAEKIASTLLGKLEQLMPSEFDWSCINSFATDTCSTMKKVWSILKQDSRVGHAFTIHCDSHGIQLVLKDILDLKSIKEVFEPAAKVVDYFRHSPKQYAFLRKYQESHYGKHYALSGR